MGVVGESIGLRQAPLSGGLSSNVAIVKVLERSYGLYFMGCVNPDRHDSSS